MTNREWLESLSDEEFVRIVCYSCKCCVGQSDFEECLKQSSCYEGRAEWLKKEHKEDEAK